MVSVCIQVAGIPNIFYPTIRLFAIVYDPTDRTVFFSYEILECPSGDRMDQREEGVTDKQFQFFDNEEQFMSKAAKTPRSNCVLDTTKAEKAGIGMRPVEEAMHESMQKWLS